MTAKRAIDLSALVRDTFEPKPELPDIVTFAAHPSFAGDSGPGLFPRQQTILRLIFCDLEHMTPYDHDVIEEWRNGFHLGTPRWGIPYDIWDRLEWLRARNRQHFSHVIFIGGRRAGKGHLGALMVAYEWYRLLLLGDPQAHYGLAKGKHLRTQIMATNYIQARDNVFADLFALVTNAACF